MNPNPMNPCPECGREMIPANPDASTGTPYIWYCPTGTPDQHRIAALEKELEEAKADGEKVDQRLLRTIDSRDAAEEAASQMYYLITGNSPHWSNCFGYNEAIEDVDDAQQALHAWGKRGDADTAALKTERDAAMAQVAMLHEQIKRSGVHDLPCKIDGCSCGLEAVLSSTAATAQEWVAKHDEQVLERVDAYLERMHGPNYRAASGIRAAILGENPK